jgi:hypothetical protein
VLGRLCSICAPYLPFGVVLAVVRSTWFFLGPCDDHLLTDQLFGRAGLVARDARSPIRRSEDRTSEAAQDITDIWEYIATDRDTGLQLPKRGEVPGRSRYGILLL